LFSNQQRQSAKFNRTPEVLQNSRGNGARDYSLSIKRGRGDIVHKLYEEALEKDPKLVDIEEKIKAIEEIKYASTKDYQKFSANSSWYWTDANRYVSQINDSVLQQTMAKLLKEMQNKYDEKMANHMLLNYAINEKRELLNDHHTFLKLAVTMKMMDTYFNNEKPDVKPMQSVNKRYDELIKEISAVETLDK